MRLSQTQQFGFKWELWALQQLIEHGYEGVRLLTNYYASSDLMLGSMPIEVKAARPKTHFTHCYRTRWQFDTTRLPRGVDHIVILIALDFDEQPYPFIVPSWLIGDRHNIHITSHPNKFRGILAPCLNAWGNVAAVKQIHDYYGGQLFLDNMDAVLQLLNPQSQY